MPLVDTVKRTYVEYTGFDKSETSERKHPHNTVDSEDWQYQ